MHWSDKKLEREVEIPACRRILKELGIWSVKLQKTGEAGWPDRMFILPRGKVFFIEFKRPGEKPTVIQLQIHARLRYFGHAIQVHDDVEEAVQAVRRKLGSARVPAKGSQAPSAEAALRALHGSRTGQDRRRARRT